MNNETNAYEQRNVQRYSNSNPRRKPSKSKYLKKTAGDPQNKRLLVVIAVLSVILLACIILLITLNSDSSLVGMWDLDGVTAYRFDSKNSGALILPSDEYPFTYTIEGDTILIDMLYDGAKDAQYTYSVRGNKLTLAGGTDTTKNTFILKRIN